MTNLTESLPGQAATTAFLERPHQLFIGGRWMDAASGRSFPVINPATEQVISHAPAGEGADIDLAVKAARQAFEGSWSRTLPSDRAKLLWRLAELIEKNAAELALIETLNTGKPLPAAMRVDVSESIERSRYFAGWATKLTGSVLSSQGPEDWHGYTIREPVGVVGLITAWNFPLPQAVNKLAAALAAGCTAVLKPPENAPLSSLRLAELVLEAGFPEGVFNVVTGFGHTAGAALAAHHDVDKVSFTGSTVTGKKVLEAAGGNLKRVILELGGKSPVVIFPDADLERAIPGAAGIFFNSGQVCTAGSRLFAHESVFDRVVEGISQHAAKLKIGPGIAPDTDLGPVISAVQLDRILRYCDGAAREARILRGGRRVDRQGYFVEPTLIADTTPQMAVRREEIFGPVLCVSRFGEEDDLDAIARLANDTIYGLAAYIWTRNLGTAHRLARKVRAGLVNVNGGRRDPTVPSGGHKQSGWGLESGQSGIEAFTEMKSVVMGL